MWARLLSSARSLAQAPHVTEDLMCICRGTAQTASMRSRRPLGASVKHRAGNVRSPPQAAGQGDRPCTQCIGSDSAPQFRHALIKVRFPQLRVLSNCRQFLQPEPEPSACGAWTFLLRACCTCNMSLAQYAWRLQHGRPSSCGPGSEPSFSVHTQIVQLSERFCRRLVARSRLWTIKKSYPAVLASKQML